MPGYTQTPEKTNLCLSDSHWQKETGTKTKTKTSWCEFGKQPIQNPPLCLIRAQSTDP